MPNDDASATAHKNPRNRTFRKQRELNFNIYKMLTKGGQEK